MTYSIGSYVEDFGGLRWSSDWESQEIFSSNYPHDYVIGYYIDVNNEKVSYYIDKRNQQVIAIFTEDGCGDYISEWLEECVSW